MKLLMLAFILPWAAPVEAQDLESIKAEANLERRSEIALIYAGDVLTKMRADLEAKEWKDVAPDIEEFRAAVDLSFAALKATGKNARKNPKHFKKAEVKLRELSRRLKGLQVFLAVDDRPKMDEIITYVDKLQDELVELTMGVRK